MLKAGFSCAQGFGVVTEDLKGEGRYRVFQNVNRIAGQFPRAIWQKVDGTREEVLTWCTNDYLGMGQTVRSSLGPAPSGGLVPSHFPVNRHAPGGNSASEARTASWDTERTLELASTL